MMRWKARGRWIEPADRPLIMGIVNITPDSFWDGGQFRSVAAALAFAHKLVDDGADLLDIGGESSRPGSEPISTTAELARVIPLLKEMRPRFSVPLSVDTTKPEVARAAIRAGADIINDIRGLTDPGMLGVVADSDVGLVIMHMQGVPRTMQDAPEYRDVVAEVFNYLNERVRVAMQAGIDGERIAIDPGIGFGKTNDHNLELLRHLDRFAAIGCPILAGTSRKGFLGALTGRPVAERQVASVASALACVAAGASVVRVHDVAATRDAFVVWENQRGWEPKLAPPVVGT